MDLFLDHLGTLRPASVYVVLAVTLVLCGLGLPIPEDISLISAGYMAHLGVLNVHAAFAVCFSSVLAGDMVAFTLGRRVGPHALRSRFLRRVFTPSKQERARDYFDRYGSKVIFVARFLPGLRFTIFFSAGSLGFRPLAFFACDALAAALSVPALVYLAWHFGEDIDHVVSWAHRSQWSIVIGVIGLVLLALWKATRPPAVGARTSEPPPMHRVP